MEMNLQYFAEEAASAPETGAPEGNEATESETIVTGTTNS